MNAIIVYFKSCKELIDKYNNGKLGLFYITKNICDEAIKALEKQIPKKPNKAIDSTWGIQKEVNICPVCDCYLSNVHFIGVHKVEENKKITFCETCGQAIDWSDEE